MALVDELKKFFSSNGDSDGTNSYAPSESEVTYPATNLWEGDDFFYAEAMLPGQKLADLQITATGEGQLTIKGRRQRPAVEDAEWHCRERLFGTFEKIIDLPVAVESARAEAQMQNGLLTIKIAKKPEAMAKTIPVRTE